MSQTAPKWIFHNSEIVLYTGYLVDPSGPQAGRRPVEVVLVYGIPAILLTIRVVTPRLGRHRPVFCFLSSLFLSVSFVFTLRLRRQFFSGARIIYVPWTCPRCRFFATTTEWYTTSR